MLSLKRCIVLLPLTLFQRPLAGLYQAQPPPNLRDSLAAMPSVAATPPPHRRATFNHTRGPLFSQMMAPLAATPEEKRT